MDSCKSVGSGRARVPPPRICVHGTAPGSVGKVGVTAISQGARPATQNLESLPHLTPPRARPQAPGSRATTPDLRPWQETACHGPGSASLPATARRWPGGTFPFLQTQMTVSAFSEPKRPKTAPTVPILQTLLPRVCRNGKVRGPVPCRPLPRIKPTHTKRGRAKYESR